MAPRRAIDSALALARMPTLASFIRKQALPADILDLIQIAAGNSEMIQAATKTTGESPRTLRRAAILFLQEGLFFPEADVHRNLGVTSATPRGQTRTHMRWLLQWLHPDHNNDEAAALLAARVIKAWQIIGRQSLPNDAGTFVSLPLPSTAQEKDHRPTPTPFKVRWIRIPLSSDASPSHRKKTIILFFVTVLLVVFSVIPSSVALNEKSSETRSTASTGR